MINRRKFLKSVGSSLLLTALPTQLISSKEPELKYFKNYCRHNTYTIDGENFNLKDFNPYVRYVTFPGETTLEIVEKYDCGHVYHRYLAFNANKIHDVISNMSVFDIEKCIVGKDCNFALELNISGIVFKLADITASIFEQGK